MEKDEQIKKLKSEIDSLQDELSLLRPVKKFLIDSHLQLINDIEIAVNTTIDKYTDKEFDDMPVEDMLTILKSFRKYINEYKRSYKI
jgi:hypothetical protein